jgi:putative oxidoreductase
MFTTTRQKLLIPSLATFYEWAPEMGFALMRVVIGGILFMHGWVKLQTGVPREIDFFVTHQFPAPVACAYIIIFLETIGAVCVVVGLFTRFFAAALAIELGIAFLVIHLPHGFSASRGGFEYVLLLGIVMFAIALRGGGPYSVDRAIGREL